MKILIVCLGNICRSPLAEGILKHKLGDGHTIDSAGTIAYHQGSQPDHRSVKTAFKNGIDISDQKSRPITSQDLDEFDLIFCMDKNNYRDVLQMANEVQKPKIRLILDANREVPDPYFGRIDDFDEVFSLLDESCEIIAKKIQNHTI
ncbi:MAG: low molecular weight phosphotyrosine protein phosphatase [Weeksellaceae bacterium]|nr:low molecular weight phosphotyrosine protein phosphatase [Weeksellaceae bacterium]